MDEAMKRKRDWKAIDAARSVAMAAHEGQKRKYTFDPYFNHCANVAGTVALCDVSDEAVMAAYLHDVVEDTAHTIVSHPEDGNRKVRKAIDRQHLAGADVEGATIKLADVLDNASSIMLHDPGFAEVYMPEKRAILGVLNPMAPAGLFRRAWAIIERWEAQCADAAEQAAMDVHVDRDG